MEATGVRYLDTADSQASAPEQKQYLPSSYEAFVRRHWGVHPKTGPAPDARVMKAVTQFANIASAITVVLSQRDAGADLFVACMGLVGETGEIVEHLKKHVRDGVLDRNKLRLELGDALFYLTRLAQIEDPPEDLLRMAHEAYFQMLKALDFSLGEVTKANIEKLEARYGRHG